MENRRKGKDDRRIKLKIKQLNKAIALHYGKCNAYTYFKRKALDNIDLNLVSHRYVSGVLKDDHFVSARSLLASDRSRRGLFQP